MLLFDGSKFDGEFLYDVSDHFVLQRKNICQLAIILVGPDLLRVLRLHEAGANANSFARLPHASVKDVAHTEIASDLLRLGSLAGVPHDRAAGDYEQS